VLAETEVSSRMRSAPSSFFIACRNLEVGSFWPSTMPPLEDVGLGGARVSFTTKGSAALESGEMSP
jgi:hypothetical protein